jgi:DNA-binding transcriptional regulator YdaS (Cro superfamily)
MYKSDVIKFFGNQVSTGRALGVTKSAVSQWKEVVPEAVAYRAQRVSRNKLKVDPSLYPPHVAHANAASATAA